MPYGQFIAAARAERHDVERLQRAVRTSFEQVCHRLSNLQRPGARGVPFFFVRVDMAGNITKRHSSTRLQFARYGGACPLWVVHEAVALPGRIMVQLAEMPDGARYVSMARGLSSGRGRSTGRTGAMPWRSAARSAMRPQFVYADALARTTPTPIGTSCRICPREDCAQRAFRGRPRHRRRYRRTGGSPLSVHLSASRYYVGSMAELDRLIDAFSECALRRCAWRP